MPDLFTTYIVSGTAIEQDGKFLLVQERKPSAYGLWNWPAGRVEIGQTLEEVAIRETKEETGFDVEITGKIAVFQHDLTVPPGHLFKATITGGTMIEPNDEIMALRWFTAAEMQELVATKQVRGRWIEEVLVLLEKHTSL